MLIEGLAGPISEQQVALLSKVVSSSESLLEMVGGLLEVVRLRSGKATRRLRICDPCKIIEKAVLMVTPQAKQKSVEIRFAHLSGSRVGLTTMKSYPRFFPTC